MRRSRATAALLMAAFVLHPVTANAQAGPTEGYTDVRIEGSTVVIVVNLDVLYAPADSYGPPDPEGMAALNAGFAAAQRFWNDAFARLGGCPQLRLELNVEFETGESSDVDGHIVYPYSAWRAGSFPDGRGLPTVEFPQIPPDTPGDADITDPYEHAAVAYMPEWLFEDPWALAHELGHLLGLGDDYRDGEILPGRDGTLMGGTLGGDYVDRSILDDIATIARNAGYDLPECWEAHGDLESTVVYADGANCSDAVRFDATFTIGQDGAVAGDATATHVRLATCSFSALGHQWETSTMEVTGRREGDVIRLTLSPPEPHPVDGIEYGGFDVAVILSGGTALELTVTGSSARGPFDISAESGTPPATYSVTGSLEATCPACSAPAA